MMTKPTMQDVRGALEASGLPVLHSGYSLRFPNSTLVFRMNAEFKVIALNCSDFEEKFISETDKKIFAIATIFDIERSEYSTRTNRGKYVATTGSANPERKWISIP